MAKVIAIHTSDRISFKKCRRRWNVMSDLRMGLKPFEQPRPFAFGSASHKALEVFYEPATWWMTKEEGPRAILVNNAVQAFVDYMVADKAKYLAATGKASLDFDQQAEFEEDLALGKGMLRHYFDYVHRKDLDKFEPVGVEVDFEVDIFTPEEIAEEFPWLDPGTRIVYRGRIDLLIKDAWGEYWIWDHKTTARVKEVMSSLELDEQLGSYNWALEQKLGIRIAGNVYAEIFKGYPQPLQELKVIRKGCRFSTNKQNPTSYEIAKAQLEAEGEDLSLYADFLHYLQQEGQTFVQRTEVRRNSYELHEMGERIKDEVRDMLSPTLRAYPSPNPFSCDQCPVRMVCIAMNDGSDYEWILNTYFNKEKRPNAQ